MAEYQLSGNVKKGIKVKYTDPYSDANGSRTYNGLNVNTDATLEAGAVNGVFIGTAAGVFDSLFSGATQNTNIGVVYSTEENLEVVNNG